MSELNKAATATTALGKQLRAMLTVADALENIKSLEAHTAECERLAATAHTDMQAAQNELNVVNDAVKVTQHEMVVGQDGLTDLIVLANAEADQIIKKAETEAVNIGHDARDKRMADMRELDDKIAAKASQLETIRDEVAEAQKSHDTLVKAIDAIRAKVM